MKRTYNHLKDEGLDWASGAGRCLVGEETRIRREPTLAGAVLRGYWDEYHSGFSALFSSPTTDHRLVRFARSTVCSGAFYSQPGRCRGAVVGPGP